jgi:DNA-binding transcriptional regulator YiaG
MATQLNAPLLKLLRTRFMYTHAFVAEHLGVPTSVVQQIECGQQYPLAFANKLATLYQCAPKQLLTDEKESPKNWALVEGLR